MSRVCQVTGKRPITGNNVSHSNIKSKRRFLPNLHSHRFWVESENRWVKLRVSTKGLRIIDKKGIDVVLADLRARGEKFQTRQVSNAGLFQIFLIDPNGVKVELNFENAEAEGIKPEIVVQGTEVVATYLTRGEAGIPGTAADSGG